MYILKYALSNKENTLELFICIASNCESFSSLLVLRPKFCSFVLDNSANLLLKRLRHSPSLERFQRLLNSE